MLTKIVRRSLSKATRCCFATSELSSAQATSLLKREKLQFSKKRLTDWGELPPGEIPDALQYDHPFGNKSFSYDSLF